MSTLPARKTKLFIALSSEERQQLETLARSGRRSIREKIRARILLLADSNREDGGLTDTVIARQIGCALLTVAKVRQRCEERGALSSISHKRQEKRKPRALDGEQEARLVTLCCSAPPQGRKRWTLKMLKQRLIELEVVESIGCETIRRTLKKRTQAVAEERLVYPARTKCCLCLRDGRCIGSLFPPV
jgi:transposase